MTLRRDVILGAAALAVSGLGAGRATAAPEANPAAPAPPPPIDPQFMPTLVRVQRELEPGTIHVVSPRYFLYYIVKPGRAIRYGVAVGKAELVFRGQAQVGRKVEWPSWKPTPEMIARNPGAYARYADGMPGGPRNPLGARALYLYQNGHDTAIRIHGTTEPQSIGSAVSNGCIRMVNAHVVDLYQRVPLGTRVFVY